MQAIQINAFGGPEQMALVALPTPEPGASDLLVRVVAAGVNPIDWKIRSGAMAQAIGRPLPVTLGWAASGTVVGVGAEVGGFAPGDEVCFYAEFARGGCYAEYVTVNALQVALKPRGLSFVQAAALPMSGQAAWTSLIEVAALQPGMRVLIHGAGGALGRVAVQLAHRAGAQVCATASADQIDEVRRLGADTVIDHRRERFEERFKDLDVVLDTVGGETQEASWSTLKAGGLLVATATPPPPDKASALGLRSAFVFTRPDGRSLTALAQLADNGQLEVNVGQELPLADAAQAHRIGQTGQARAKTVLRVASPLAAS
ncbi:MAG: NADP-dependent oxidoreductase [Hydrogenophaga sp.]|jgi:NADPH:quinone reductase-like Zn-dependent oxidoreductase|nr:NADP-dependent oxidoreductase [Hydrogenophaga sp.]